MLHNVFSPKLISHFFKISDILIFYVLVNHIPTVSYFKIACKSKNKFFMMFGNVMGEKWAKNIEEIHENFARSLEVYCTTFKGTHA
jgi:hypothetical protein